MARDRRLQRAVDTIALQGGFMGKHVKERWNFPDRNPEKRLLIGERAPEVRWS